MIFPSAAADCWHALPADPLVAVQLHRNPQDNYPRTEGKRRTSKGPDFPTDNRFRLARVYGHQPNAPNRRMAYVGCDKIQTRPKGGPLSA
jgi:hypothetical protein